MTLLLARLIGSSLNRWKWKQDRKVHGIWFGPPPRLLSEHDLLCGDVLFCGDTGPSKPSRIILTASAGTYVHCGLYIGHGTVVDVVPDGIRAMPLDTFVASYSYVAATRCPGNEEFRTRRKAILKFARISLKGGVRGYNYFGAAISPVKELLDLRNLDKLWQRSRKTSRLKAPRAKRSFCAEFIVEAYMACGYIPREDRFLAASRRTPSGLAEENIFGLQGYMSTTGWAAVSPDDHFLGGCGWVLTKEGRDRLEKRHQDMLATVRAATVLNPNIPKKRWEDF